jgi:lipopolysaccharide export system protein LptA
MFRRLTMALLGALSLVAVVAPASSGATAPTRESGNPINDQGSSYHYRSNVTAVTPNVPGLQLEVLEFADRLVLTNHTGKTITVYGYEGEPYARVLADGTVQVNTRSPAYFLNQNFYGDVNVPSSASSSAPARWTVLDRTGQLEWHDHRIHWMSPALPPQVKDQSKRTKIFDWRVPIRVGAQPGAIAGQLFWVPPAGSKTPLAAIVALAVVLVAAIALVVFVRRRRGQGGPRDGDGDGAGGRVGAEEAW